MVEIFFSSARGTRPVKIIKGLATTMPLHFLK
jgi:hypothetical protein